MWRWWARRPDEDVRDEEDVGTLDEGMDEGMEGMEGMVSLVIECAWCLAEQGIVPTSGSHGICPFHAQQVLEAARARHQRHARGQR